MKKVRIEVRKKGAKYYEPGEVIEVIYRKPWAEQMGNFSPIFCRYQGEVKLVRSLAGDLSDPFRRTEEYAETLFIEVEGRERENE